MFSKSIKNKLKSHSVLSNSKNNYKNDVLFNGVALHSGVNVNICIKPAAPNFGIVFKRIDHKINNLVYPNFMHVTNTH